MSMPTTLSREAEKLYQETLDIWRDDVLAQPAPDLARDEGGRFVARDVSWTRTNGDGTTETRHLPHYFGADDPPDAEWLMGEVEFLKRGLAVLAVLWTFAMMWALTH